MDAIQCYEGEGIDAEGEFTALLGRRLEAIEDQWSVIDYLDDFNHTIEAHQWHIPTRELSMSLSGNYEKRQALVRDFRVALDFFHRSASDQILIDKRPLRNLKDLIGAIVIDNATQSFKDAANTAYNVLERWGDELVEIGAHAR